MWRVWHVWQWLCLATAMALAMGCHSPVPPPKTALISLDQALAADDAAAVYALLSSDLKRAIPKSDFLALWQENVREREALQADLKRLSTRGPSNAPWAIDTLAAVEIADGETVTLVKPGREASTWGVDGIALSGQSHSQPESLFLATCEAFSVLKDAKALGLFDPRAGAILTDHVAALSSGLCRQTDLKPIHLSTTRAQLRYRAGANRVILTADRTVWGWRISDVAIVPSHED